MVSKYRVASGVLYKHARDQVRVAAIADLHDNMAPTKTGLFRLPRQKRNIRLNSNRRESTICDGIIAATEGQHTPFTVYVTLTLVLPQGGYDAIRHATTSQYVNPDRVSQANDRATSFFFNTKDQDLIVYTIKKKLYIMWIIGKFMIKGIIKILCLSFRE